MGCDRYAFLSVVDISEQTSKVLLCGGREVALAKMAFKGTQEFLPSASTNNSFQNMRLKNHLEMTRIYPTSWNNYLGKMTWASRTVLLIGRILA